jgi:hypothetical protein
VTILGALGVFAAPAGAANQRSARVAIIDGEGASSVLPLQTSGTVVGASEDSFEAFSFTHLSQEEIEPASIAPYDTVVLNEVFTASLTSAQKSTLANFVTSGGKLIIHDADGTEGNEYTWLPVPATTGASCQNCGKTNGESVILENNTIVSNDPSSRYFIDVSELPGHSDAIGDANFLVTTDPRWSEDIRGKNDQNVEGAADAYASAGGLMMYNGFDYDYLGQYGAFPSGIDWLNKLWWNELDTQWNPDNLPHSTPVIGPGGHCGFKSVRVGVATVCAESITGSLTETTATGNVVLDGGVSVGNGPITIDQSTQQITVPATTVSLLRSSGPITLGTAGLTIDASGSTDPLSGKQNLARVSLTGANLALAALRVGGLPFSIPSAGSLTMYLTSESGGGLIAAGDLQLPTVNKVQSSAGLSLGFFAGVSPPVVPLGGAAHFGGVQFAPGWKLESLDLAYQSGSDTWTASGGLEVPLGKVSASGSVVGGALDSMNVAISGLDVPVGDSGFFFSGFGGGLSGLARGPLSISASTQGFWGAPHLPVEPFYLDNVNVTVNLGGSISLDGAVSLILNDNSPVHGQLHLKLAFQPFSAVGTTSIDGSLPGVSINAHGGAGFTTKHFTAAEGGSLKVFGLSGGGDVIASDKGLGASGTLCAPFHSFCNTMAFAGTWSQLGNFDIPSLIGGEPRKLITVSGVASAHRQSGSVRVPAGRALLLVTATQSGGSPEVTLTSPGRKTYRRSTRRVLFNKQAQFGLTTIAVIDPAPGRWRITSSSGTGPVSFSAQTMGTLKLVHAGSIAPASSQRHPLAPQARVVLSWSSSHLPRGVRITVVRKSNPHEVGIGLAGNLPSSGHYVVPVGKLAPGRNFVSIAATLHGVPFQQVTFRGVVWRASALKHKAKHRKRR